MGLEWDLIVLFVGWFSFLTAGWLVGQGIYCAFFLSPLFYSYGFVFMGLLARLMMMDMAVIDD